MQTVDSVELAIQKYEKQQNLIVGLIQNLRREPSWQPNGLRDERSERLYSNYELEFRKFAQHSETMNSVIGWFRDQVLTFQEDQEAGQEKLNEIGKQMSDVIPALQEMSQRLWTMLNAFRTQRGAQLYPPISSIAT